MDRRKELGDFLRAKRAQASVPGADQGWGSPRRRVPGLRREEVAARALISLTYYTKLERGRVQGISVAVLDGLAAALDLSPDERAYVARLIPVTGELVPRSVMQPDEVGPILQRVLDGLADLPAHVQNERCDLVASNALGRALYPFHFEAEHPNTVAFLFLDPRARTFFLDWEKWADQGVHHLRAASARDPEDRALQRMIRDLRAASPDFDDAWQSHEVTWAPTGTRCLAHPAVGRLDLDFQNLLVAGQPGLRITVYSGEPGTATFERLGRLRELLEQAP